MADPTVMAPDGNAVGEPPAARDGPIDAAVDEGPPQPSSTASAQAPAADVLAFFESERKLADDGTSQNMDQVLRDRKRTDLWGKGVLGLGTALLTALGIGKLADFLPQDGAVNQIVATLGLVVALGAVMFIGVRLSRVSLPIVMRANTDSMGTKSRANPDGLAPGESMMVGSVYARFAAQNGVLSVAQYAAIATVIESTFTILANDGKSPVDVDPERRGHEVASIAKQLHEWLGADANGDGKAGAVPAEKMIRTYVAYTLKYPDLARAKASLVRAELRWVMTSALADIVGRRAVNATTDRQSLVILALVPLGVLVSVAVTYFGNANDVNRIQDWQDAKTCVEVATAAKQAGLVKLPECAFPAPLTSTNVTPTPGGG